MSRFWDRKVIEGEDEVMRRFLPLRLRRWLPSASSLTTPALIARLYRCRAGSPIRALSIPRARCSLACRAARGCKGTRRPACDFPLVAEAGLDGRSAHFIRAGDFGFVLTCGVFVLFCLGVAVEVQIRHDVPVSFARAERAAQTQDFTRQHPPDQPDGMTALIVRRDGDIDVLGRGVGVAERDDGDVDVGSLLNGLGIGTRVRDDDDAGFLEGARDVVGEVARGEAPRDGGGAGVGGEFEDGALAVGAGGDDGDVGGVVDGDEHAGGEDDLLPGKSC